MSSEQHLQQKLDYSGVSLGTIHIQHKITKPIVQIFISQSTDFHFAKYRFQLVSFRFAKYHFAKYNKPNTSKMSQAWSQAFLNLRQNSEHVNLVISGTRWLQEHRIFRFLNIRNKKIMLYPNQNFFCRIAYLHEI